jgi:hypothetical protein
VSHGLSPTPRYWASFAIAWYTDRTLEGAGTVPDRAYGALITDFSFDDNLDILRTRNKEMRFNAVFEYNWNMLSLEFICSYCIQSLTISKMRGYAPAIWIRWLKGALRILAGTACHTILSDERHARHSNILPKGVVADWRA